MIKARVDVSGFGAVIKALSKISGKDFKTVLEAEAGHIIQGAIRKTPISSVKGRKSRGKTKGGIVPRHMPKGMTRHKGQGNKLISKTDGKTYHVGEPVLDRINPDERTGNLGRNYSKKVGIKKRRYKSPSGKYPMRGGKVWLYPKGPWMGRNKFWGEAVPRYEKRTDRKVANIGLGAGQFYWMGKQLGLTLPATRLKGRKEISKDSIKSKVSAYISPKRVDARFNYHLILESRGLRTSKWVRANYNLAMATKARITLFKTSVRKEYIKDVKEYMPKKYPLLFS